MTPTHISVYKKYVQARSAFREHTAKFLDNLGSGSKSKKRIATYNTIASWLDFIGNNVPAPINRAATSPNKVIFKVVPLEVQGLSIMSPPIIVFVETAEGVRNKIGRTSTDTNLAGLAGIFDTHPDVSSTFNSDTTNTTLTFEPGSKYNGGRVVCSATARLEPTTVIITGGADAVNTSLKVTGEELKKIDTMLDKTAIELNIVYTDKKYAEILNGDRASTIKTALKTTNNLSLTTEDGSPLEV
tara:strand:- start:738 stop:1466 length:729 start_codon:yes stop_codon:yes gene_type:complete